MRKITFYPHLAVTNVLRNNQFYLPYLLTNIATVAMFYILAYLSFDDTLASFPSANNVQVMMALGCIVVGIFSTILVFYTNSFVMKRRRRELGLYNILGLEKRHTARLMVWETLYCAAAAILGVTAGTAVSMLFLVGYLAKHRNRTQSLDVPSGSSHLIRQILAIGIPITLSNSAMSILNIIDTKIVMGQLQNALLLSEESAAALNGQYSMAMDMPNMVASFVYPVTMSLIPFAAAALARQDHAGADRIISSAFRIIAILALPAGIGLSVLSTPIMVLVLPAQREDALAAGPHLQVLGIALIFICLMILTNAILQTYGKEKLPIFTVIVGGIVKIIMNYFLVGNPDINIHGAPISTLCCYLVIVVLNLFFVWKYSPQKPRYLEVFAKPVAASLLMGGAAWAVYGLASRVLDGAFLALAQQMFADPDKIQLWSVYLANAACVLLGILAGVIVYGVLVIALRILRAEDVRSIPRGEKLIKLLHLK